MLINCHTYYSLCYGAMSPESLLNEVEEKGYTHFCLTDINNTSACIDTNRLAKERNISLQLGIDFRNGITQQYIGIARNNEGFRELNEHLSHHLHTGKPYHGKAPLFHNAYIIYPFSNYKGQALKPYEWLGVSISDLQRFGFSRNSNLMDKMVVLQTGTFRNKRDYNSHRLLRAIDNNMLLSHLPVLHQAKATDVILPQGELLNAFKEYPQIVFNTEKLLDSFEGVDFRFGENKNKTHFTSSVDDDYKLLEYLCEEGLKYRYDKPDNAVLERVKKELSIIRQMNFGSYFLINWDLVNYARSQGYYYVGRGSGANSMVAYLLRITDVDPIELDLYFERFINPYRTTPPDFDIDFSWTDRDDITHYIFQKYGKGAALLGAYNTFQHAAILRELGKVFGLPPDDIDKLQRGQLGKDQYGDLVLKYSHWLKGFPSHLSIHASGILISDKPITCYTGTHLPPKGYPTTQFSMLEAEDVGLYKFDILSQRGLGKIKDTLDIIKENRAEQIDIHDVKRFMKDPKVKDMLRSGMAIGCFYVESPAMRMLLTKLGADDYKGLVAASSIIRPGVAKSGMMREYIVRFRDMERREQAKNTLPKLYEILHETYGVMVYQEDVIKVAHYFAELTLAEADILRRGMSWKFKQRNEFWKVRDKFFNNCREKGYDEQTITEIWTQIETFANFAFSKGHSASYAVESFQALYLKAYYPKEYIVATLNNGGGFYRTELYVHEARINGAKIVAPCVNNSQALCSIQDDVIYMGLQFIKELNDTTILEVLKERTQNGFFTSLRDFMNRVSLSMEQLKLLIRAGGFRFTQVSKKEMLWDVHFLLGPHKTTKPVKRLFDTTPKELTLPQLSEHELDDAFDEIDLLGFPLCSPFKLLQEYPSSQLVAAELGEHIGKTTTISAYLIHIKNTLTGRGERMHFGTWLDQRGQWLDTVHFPPSVREFPFTGPGCYTITGKVTEEFGFISIEVESMHRLQNITIDQPDNKHAYHGKKEDLQKIPN